jgi:glucose-6-phosphate 1-epimerase
VINSCFILKMCLIFEQDISTVSITGLESSPYTDKVLGPTADGKPYESPAGVLSLSSKTDRVYTPTGGPSAAIIIREGGKKKFGIVRDNLNEMVVWNPWKDDAQGMGDFAPKEGYKEMICVEAGAVRGWQKLEAGETFEGGQVIMTAN